MTNAQHDDNRVAGILGVSSADGVTPLPLKINPNTGRVLVESTTAGADGRNAGFLYQFNTNTAASDPGSGKLKFNNATFSSATVLYISETDNDSNSLAAELATWDDSTSTVKGKIKITETSDPTKYVLFQITGSITDSGTYDRFTITYISGNLTTLSNNENISILFLATGDKGADGSSTGDVVGPGSATDNAITRYDGTTGKLIQNSSATLSDTGDIETISTSAGATGPSLSLYHNSASPANSDVTGLIQFNANNDAAAKKEFARIEQEILGDGAGAEAGKLNFYVSQSGSITKLMGLANTEMKLFGGTGIISDTGQDCSIGTPTGGFIYMTEGGDLELSSATTINMLNPLVISSNAPLLSSSVGVAGTITYDSNFIYICVATNTWKRIAITTF